MRRVAGQTGYCGQTLQQHFGLGDASIVDSMIIEWPSGIKQVLQNVNVNNHLNLFEDTTATSVETGEVLPTGFMLYQNYPNPFNPTTKIKYTIPSVTLSLSKGDIPVSLKVFDVLGNEITTLVNEQQQPGTYEVEFNVGQAINLSSGVYYYQLRVYPVSGAGGFVETKKMIIMK